MTQFRAVIGGADERGISAARPMLSRMADTERTWRSHLAAFAAVIVAVAVGGLIAFFGLVGSAFGCPGMDDEGTTFAPQSGRARMLCGDGGSGDMHVGVYGLFVIVLIATVLAVVLWWRRAHVRWFIAALAGSIVVPLLLVGVGSLVSADCTDEEWDRFGSAGCERNAERR